MCKRMIWDDFKRLLANWSEQEDMNRATIELRRTLAEAASRTVIYPNMRNIRRTGFAAPLKRERQPPSLGKLFESF